MTQLVRKPGFEVTEAGEEFVERAPDPPDDDEDAAGDRHEAIKFAALFNMRR